MSSKSFHLKSPKWFLLFSMLLYPSSLLLSQQNTISGMIRDQNTHREIRGVNIYIKDTAIGSSSDVGGRFNLRVPAVRAELKIVFKHIAYETREVRLDSLKAVNFIYLQPRVIPLQGVQIEGKSSERLKIEDDLPQTTSVIDARNFEIRGYVDAGDLLRTEQSVQIDEDLSGKKTIAIRGGNPEEVVVLYNGVKLNNNFDNVFDLSLINLEDIERFEIIKGSNTVLYGPEAFSGVINVVPKVQQDYNIRFQQRLGTYRSGNWGLHLYKNFDRLYGSYSVKRGKFKREFVGFDTNDGTLKNSNLHHTANLNYAFSKNSNGRLQNTLGAMWVYSSLDFDNFRDGETLSNLNNLFSLKYKGDIFKLRNFDTALSFRRLKEKQKLANASFERHIDDRALFFNIGKSFKIKNVDLLFAYQFQNTELDFFEFRENATFGIESADFQRRHHGLVSIVKYHAETGSNFIQNYDLDFSIRHDRVQNDQSNVVPRTQSRQGVFDSNDWQDTMFKFALNINAYREDLAVTGFFNFGDNTKFPTLLQQISVANFNTSPGTRPNLNPERNRSLELGVEITKDTRENLILDGVQFEAAYFKNIYDNKIRTFNTVGVPVAFYDNVQTANITGLESKVRVFLLRKKVTLQAGVSRYFINEKAAFPFKADFKRTIDLIIDHEGFSFQFHWFKEGKQAGWLRELDNVNEFFQIILPSYSNFDVHLSKSIAIGKLKIFGNFSGRNLLNNSEIAPQGLAIRDRRFYFTFGAQY